MIWRHFISSGREGCWLRFTRLWNESSSSFVEQHSFFFFFCYSTDVKMQSKWYQSQYMMFLTFSSLEEKVCSHRQVLRHLIIKAIWWIFHPLPDYLHNLAPLLSSRNTEGGWIIDVRGQPYITGRRCLAAQTKFISFTLLKKTKKRKGWES